MNAPFPRAPAAAPAPAPARAARLRALWRTASFRLGVGAGVLLTVVSLLQCGLACWQAARFERGRVDRLLAAEVRSLAAEPEDSIRWHVGKNIDLGLHRLVEAGLFDRAGRPLAGSIARYPADLPPDGRPRVIALQLDGRLVRVRAASLRLADGSLLLVGRDMGELVDIRRIMLDALLVAFLPALGLSLAGGAWLGVRALVRVGDLNRSLERIVAGDLEERLPEGGGRDDLDRLAASVNRMLGRIESLVAELRATGDDIAHDLRTPLARVRTTLERAREHPARQEAAIDKAIGELDRVFAVITALLRIAEFAHRRRHAGFAPASLRAIADEAIELYEPVAEAAGLALVAAPGADAVIDCDRDLLIEAVANLLDNACKFTAPGGRVEVAVQGGGERVGVALSVADDGIGLSEVERGEVLRRFYRADRSRHVPGNGLGLSIVAAIAAVHDAVVAVEDRAPGTRFALVFPPGQAERQL